MIQINGFTLPTPSVFTPSIMDISKAERNARGNIMIDRIATKRKIELEWKYVSTSDMPIILNAVKDVFFQVTYHDPLLGVTTKTFYVGDRAAPMLDYVNDIPRWKDFKMNLVER